MLINNNDGGTSDNGKSFALNDTRSKHLNYQS